jgi:hypothetical protein
MELGDSFTLVYPGNLLEKVKVGPPSSYKSRLEY